MKRIFSFFIVALFALCFSPHLWASSPATVHVYQTATVDTTKILYDLPANAVDLGTGVAWATTDYDASTASKFAAENRGNNGLTASGSSITSNIWYLYANVTPPANWRFPTRTECENAFANGTSRIQMDGTNNYRMRIESSISDDYVEIGAHGYVLYSSDWYYGDQYSWQMMNYPYVWISQNECFSLNTSTNEPEFVDCDASCMMTTRFVYSPSNTHTLTIHVGEHAYTYMCQEGQQVTFTAHPQQGYQFQQWLGSGLSDNTIAEQTITVNADAEYRAIFNNGTPVSLCTLTINAAGGNVSVSPNPISSSQNTYTYLQGTQVTITVTSNPWATFARWEDENGNQVSTDNPYIVTINSNVTYNAVYGLESADAAVDVYQNVSSNSTKILYYLPEEKEFKDGKKYSAIDMGYGVAWADRNVGATSTSAHGGWYQWGGTTDLTTTVTNNGRGPNSGGKSTANTSALTATEDAATVVMGANWHMPAKAEWESLINNTTVNVNSSTFTNKTDGSKSISLPTGGYYYNSGRDFDAYSFYWANQRSAGDEVYMLRNNKNSSFQVSQYDGTRSNGYTVSPKCVMPIRAIYVPSYTTYTLTINVGSYSYQYICQAGQSITVTANATTSGNVFDKWLLENGSTPDNVDGTLATRTFVMTENITRTATFKEAPSVTTYNVTIVSNDTEYGTVSESAINGVESGTGITVSGSTLTIGSTTVTATKTTDDAQYTYAFSSWTKSPDNATVTDDMTITANFTRTAVPYTLTYEGLEGATNSNPASYTVESEFDFAAPGTRDGWTFTGWTCGGEAITSIALGTTGDKTITANWEEVVTAFDLEDNHEAGDDYYDDYAALVTAGNAIDITYKRSFKAGRWATFSLPFGYSFQTHSEDNPFKDQVFELTSVDYADGRMVINCVKNSTGIVANKPYILIPTSDIDNPTFEGVTPKAIAAGSKTVNNTKDDVYTVEFISTAYKQVMPTGKRTIYISGNRLYYANVDTDIPAFRGYFNLKGGDDVLHIQPRLVIAAPDGETIEQAEEAVAETRKYMENGILVIERNGVKYDAQGHVIK